MLALPLSAAQTSLAQHYSDGTQRILSETSAISRSAASTAAELRFSIASYEMFYGDAPSPDYEDTNPRSRFNFCRLGSQTL